MTAMASNDILVKRLTCRCVTPFSLKRYVNNKVVIYSFESEEVITYELRGTKLVKDGLYSVVERGYSKVTITGDIGELANFTKSIK